MTNARPIILTAVPVAFHEDGRLSIEGSRAILRKVAASGVDGALVLGTTGEFPSLSEEERGELVKLSLAELAGKRCVVHVGASSAYEVERLVAQARELGAKEVASITPYFLPATDDALVDFYTRLSNVSEGLQAYAYLFRDRTGIKVSPEVLTRIAALPNIVGVKISGESLETVGVYRKAVPDDFMVYTGADREIGRIGTVGANGVISGIASVYPEPFVAIADAIEAGDKEAQARLQKDVDAVVDAIIGDMGRMKSALRRQGIEAGVVRMAIEAPSAEIERLLDETHKVYGKTA